jgi:hypothetical protein
MADVQEVTTEVLEFSPGLLGLYGVWHCHDEAVPLLQVGLDVFCELHPKASTELHSTRQNSHFHHTSKDGLRVLPENPKTRKVSITFLAYVVTLKFVVEGERGCIHCIEACFEWGC